MSVGHALATVALGPLLWAQGRHVRRTALRLPEAAGPRAGVSGSGPDLRLLVTGDSSAAGVGAAHQDEALLGRLVRRLEARHRVVWRLEARIGARTPDARTRLEALEADPEGFDVAVTALGVNDLTAGTRLDPWLREQRALRALLRRRFGVRRIVVSGLPPMHGFPALPQPLRWYLGRRARQLDDALAAEVAGEEDAVHVPLAFIGDVQGMAPDGFHPGPPIYRAWAERVAAAAV